MNEAVVIPGFDPFMATNDGYIFNGETGKRLTTQLDKQGYEKLTFRLHGQKKNMFVHRLVALTFIPNPDCKTQINHINGVKTDNSAANLEWCTPSENIKHAYRQGLLHQDGTRPALFHAWRRRSGGCSEEDRRASRLPTEPKRSH